MKFIIYNTNDFKFYLANSIKKFKNEYKIKTYEIKELVRNGLIFKISESEIKQEALDILNKKNSLTIEVKNDSPLYISQYGDKLNVLKDRMNER